MSPDEQAKIERIFSDIISSALKAQDAPASSQTHLDQALCLLIEICPSCKPWDEESTALVEQAREHMTYYRNETPIECPPK